jgi:MoaA/NifB/PqqE/SkfB family radical SAM enzyme
MDTSLRPLASVYKPIKSVLNIRKNLATERPMPRSIAVNITGRCNLKCVFCEKSRHSSPRELDIQSIKKLIDLSVKISCPVFISGGEPFIHREIWNLLHYCKYINKRVAIVTNGTQFDSLSKEQFQLLSDATSMIMISLDSADSVEHDAMRGVKGSHEKVMRFLCNPLRKGKITISCIVYPDLNNVQGVINIARRLECAINFQPLIFESNFPELEKLEWKNEMRKDPAFPSDKIAELRHYYEYAKKLGVKTNLGLILKYIDKYFQQINSSQLFYDRVLKKFMCFIPFQQLTVNEKGGIMPCVFLPEEQTIMKGDILDNWQEIAIKYKTAFRNRKTFQVCRSCSCHFAENFRSNIIAFPIANYSQIFWLGRYYLGRLWHGTGIKV